MPRRMSFSATTRQFRDGSKTVTRRAVGTWLHLRPGDELEAVKQAMGLKPGEKQVVLGRIRITDVRVEPLSAITAADCAAEGFPELTPAAFVRFFTQKFGGTPDTPVRRIEFVHLSPEPSAQVGLFPEPATGLRLVRQTERAQ